MGATGLRTLSVDVGSSDIFYYREQTVGTRKCIFFSTEIRSFAELLYSEFSD